MDGQTGNSKSNTYRQEMAVTNVLNSLINLPFVLTV